MMEDVIRQLLAERDAIPQTSEKPPTDYGVELEKALDELAVQLYGCEDFALLGKETIRRACEFYRADWAGIILMDRLTGMWEPFWWYDAELGFMNELSFDPTMFCDEKSRWQSSLKSGEALIVTDIDQIKDSLPEEYDCYVRLATQSVIGVPFASRPDGFLVVRNPQRYPERSSFLRILGGFMHTIIKEHCMMEGTRQMMRHHDINSDQEAVFNLLGELQIRTSRGEVNESDVKNGQGWMALVYLLMHRERHVTVGELVNDCLKSDQLKAPSATLRNALFRFKQSCGYLFEHDFLMSDASGYYLNPNYRIRLDIEMFEEYYQKAEKAVSSEEKLTALRNAFKLYRGDLFPSCSNPWIARFSLYYSKLYSDVVGLLLEELNRKKDFRAISRYASEAMDVKPLLPAAHFWMAYSFYRSHMPEQAMVTIRKARRILIPEDYQIVKKQIGIYADFFHHMIPE